MGKKGKLYLVLFINLLAWGYVGYKVYGALQGDDEPNLYNTSAPVKAINEKAKDDNISLNLDYPDPFLKGGHFSGGHQSAHGSSAGRPASAVQSKPPQAVVAKPTATVVSAPAVNIRYMGLLKNTDKGTQTAMLNVNDRSVFAKLNDVIEGYTVVEIGPNAIKVKKGKELLTISK